MAALNHTSSAGQNSINTRHEWQQVSPQRRGPFNSGSTTVLPATSYRTTGLHAMASGSGITEVSLTENNPPLDPDPAANRPDTQAPCDRRFTMQPVLAELPAAGDGAVVGIDHLPRGQIRPSLLANSIDLYQPMNIGGSGPSYISVDDNNQNISVSPLLGPTTMTARPQSQFNSFRAGQGGQQTRLSSSSSNHSLKSFISDNCLVKKLPRRIIMQVAQNLQCRYPSASWKDLVEMYGWDYHRTYLFENMTHEEGVFFSLLREPEFQSYSLDQLRQNLQHLPRMDILADLDKMIKEHNLIASSGAASTSVSQNNLS